MRFGLVFALLLATPTASAMESWPDLLKAALAKNDAELLQPYELHVSAGALEAVGRVDPSADPDERLMLITPRIEELPKKQRKEVKRFAQTIEHNLQCSAFGSMIPDDVGIVEETADRIVYGFQPIPDDPSDSADFIKHLSATITVSKTEADVIAFDIWSRKSFKPNLAAKIEDYQRRVQCAPGPDGRRYVDRMEIHVKGKAAFKSFDRTIVQRVTRVGA
ncbi:MAG: hypothetical protein AAFQ67_02945 [Pseudomonadota bacterium]